METKKFVREIHTGNRSDSSLKNPTDHSRNNIIVGDLPLSNTCESAIPESPRIKVDFEPQRLRRSNRTAEIEPASSPEFGVESPRSNGELWNLGPSYL
ncbi:hypothetical protein TNCV_687031 [Trichonephila clavipes]|nr:hypothetical protein TNCV_687031 [Trichonephila clavipes]